jgi:hypothetical protein
MPGPVLTMASDIRCPHGASVLATITDPERSMVEGAPLLSSIDLFVVTGCPFTLPGPTPSPCVEVRWEAPEQSMGIGDGKALSTSSVGTCFAASGQPQGVAIADPKQTAVAAK